MGLSRPGDVYGVFNKLTSSLGRMPTLVAGQWGKQRARRSREMHRESRGFGAVATLRHDSMPLAAVTKMRAFWLIS